MDAKYSLCRDRSKKELFLDFILKKNNIMAQEINSRKEKKESDMSKEKDNTPFIQVDRHSDPISNFLSNFKRQFKRAEEIGFGRWLFGGKSRELPEPSAAPSDIIGPSKTNLRRNYNGLNSGQPAELGKKTILKTGSSIKVKSNDPGHTKKPKLRL